MASSSLWPRFQKYFLRYDDLDFSIDISRMKFADDFFAKMQARVEKAFAAMRELEAGAIANPDCEQAACPTTDSSLRFR